jgi:hypothetical protein
MNAIDKQNIKEAIYQKITTQYTEKNEIHNYLKTIQK